MEYKGKIGEKLKGKAKSVDIDRELRVMQRKMGLGRIKRGIQNPTNIL